ncbi:amidase [Marinobacterium aestuariivivens]|uniref:Amidase n=1 Tax=Marinobacterium aestuariivivens TaxID=1698799 RepID=A0ABW1ZVD6_9GAMM
MTVFVERCALGPEQGMRVAIKDSIDVAGMATRMGSAAFDNAAPAARHADVVERLLDAGCRIVGKTVLHEFAFGVSGINPACGTPRNHRYPNRIPGGSSSGSAVAVAAGEADIALGTDTGGSVRQPAACCGVYGFKPSFGRVSRHGVWPSATSLDCVGVFASTLELLERATAIVDPRFEAQAFDGELRIGLVAVEADAAIAGAVRDYVTASGCSAGEVELQLLDAAFEAGLAIINAETWNAFGACLETGRVGADVAERLKRAAETSPQAVADAERVRQAFGEQLDALLERFSVLALPTLPSFPLMLDEALAGKTDLRSTALVRPFNLSGHPALSIPLDIDGRPAGLQLVARRGDDARLLAAARELERLVAINDNND